MTKKPATRNSLRWLVYSAGAALLVATAYAAAQPQATDAIVVEQSPSLVTFAGGTEKAAGQLKVRIDGPDGQTVYESVSEAGILDWVPQANLPDGRYRWDAWFVPQSALDRPRDQQRMKQHAGSEAAYQSGVFRLEGGTLIIPDENLPKPDQARMSWPERAFGTVLQAMIPTASADQTISDATPEIFFQDTSTADGDDWIIQAQGEPTSLFGIGETLFPQFQIEGGAPVGALVIDTTGNIGLGTDTPAVELDIADTVPRLRFTDTDANTAWTVSASADEFRLQDNAGGSRPFIVDAGTDSDGAPINSLYIESPTGDIGLGTSTPQNDLHIVDIGGFQLRLESSGGFHTLDSFDGDFGIFEQSSGRQFGILAGAPTNSLVIDGSGSMGVGTGAPSAPLHVQRSDGSAQVLVRESSGTPAARELFKLSNNGGPFFIFENRDLSESYSFAMGATGHFLLSHQQTSGVQFRLRPNGDAEFQGDVTANGVVLDSSREIKTDFSIVDEDTVLEKVAALDVSQWRYTREPESERHIGPMAEDFRATFGLGDGRHISMGDANGILFAAAKALEERTEALQSETERLRDENERLKARVVEMDKLRDRLDNLEKLLTR